MMASLPLLGLFLLSLTNLNFISCDDDLKNWWRKAVIYQIYPRSFLDSDGDGVGDLKGITSKLDYVEELGVHATWLSPIYTSPMKDFGYDVEDYVGIDPRFGTMDDFDEYVKKSRKLGLKVIMDFVPNHSSDKHKWFINSENRIEPYTDYYVWVNGSPGSDGPKPPNNWLSLFGGSMWQWSSKRQQFYLHQFLKEQPDLNFNKPAVREEMKNVIRFWFKKGVDGFRIDAIKHIFEDPELRDEPRVSWETSSTPDMYDYYDHKYTAGLNEIFGVIAEWREVFDEFENKDGFHRLMMVESMYDINGSLPYFGNDTFPLADIPFNFELFQLKTGFNGYDVYKVVNGWLSGMPPTKWSNWIIGNHDNSRVANRTDPRQIDAFNMLCLLLRGTPITYYGEELGMVDTFVAFNETQDPVGQSYGPDRYMYFNRDPERTPMQWNDKQFSGFTQGTKTWLPVNQNYREVNVEAQTKNPRSHLHTYRKLVAIKKELAVINGTVHYPIVTKEIFSFCRLLKSAPAIAVIINVSNGTQRVNLQKQNPTSTYHVPPIGIIEAISNGFPLGTNQPEIRIDLRFIKLPPYQAIVVKFNPKWL